MGIGRCDPIAGHDNCLLQWQTEFPGKEDEIETFISIIHEAFLVPNKFKYNVRPSDTISFYYDMSKNVESDNLEYMVFCKRLEEAFNFKYREGIITSESELGDIFKNLEGKNDI